MLQTLPGVAMATRSPGPKAAINPSTKAALEPVVTMTASVIGVLGLSARVKG